MVLQLHVHVHGVVPASIVVLECLRNIFKWRSQIITVAVAGVHNGLTETDIPGACLFEPG